MNKFMCFALCALIGGLAMPAVSVAGNVGYTAPCLGGSPASAITAAGHTPVSVSTVNAASLASLDALIVNSCVGYNTNADINTAVEDGMVLIVNDNLPNGTTASKLPGSPAVVLQYNFGTTIQLAAGTPIETGVGGTLTNSSLDSFAFFAATRDGYTASGLSADMTKLLTTNNANNTVAFGYPQGNGYVSYNAMPIDAFLSGGIWNQLNFCTASNACAGMQTYLTNLIDWSIDQAKSCENEGYTYTKLEWCKNICERGYTGGTLDMWLRRWINRYRDLPYCAVD